jgi:A/G-specific adenine glycosylase
VPPHHPDAAALLAWYDRHRRDLPWRARPGETADPYRVWLSEIMLQQTTVAAVIPYFAAFLSRFPTVQALAGAELETVLQKWAGLGYYARARNLHACARAVAAGGFPASAEALRTLPGIGAYTATAIAAIAFNQPGVPVDGNVERVAARLFGIAEPLPGAKRALEAAAAELGVQPAARSRPADFAQALFDLGATICTPRQPACALCPWRADCRAAAQGTQSALPARTPKAARPVRHGAHFWLTDRQGRVLLRRRPERGLLGGMTELPGTDWRPAPWSEAEAIEAAPQPAAWQPAGAVRHVFTHFELRIALFAAGVERIDAAGALHDTGALERLALPSVMRKCVAAVSGARHA